MTKPILDVKYNINHNGTSYYLQHLKWESAECHGGGFHWVENLYNNHTRKFVCDKELTNTLKLKLALYYGVLTHI